MNEQLFSRDPQEGGKKIDGTKLPASFGGVELGRGAELLSQDII